ncbi:MAG: hypothetical protein JSS67_08685 [Bacteroidetes bacterium]|nr:hypothetical protein [Bacteroidota bacterium]
MNPFLVFISFILASCGQKPNTTLSDVPKLEQRISGETINLMSYGAKGLGVSSLKEDTTALRNAIAYLNSKGGGKLYVPNPPKFYAFAGDGVFVGNNIEIYGDGKGKSEIRNVDPLSGKYLRGPIFLFSTYGASDEINIFQNGVEQYSVADAKAGDKILHLKDATNASKLKVGEIVVIGSGVFNHGTGKAKSRFHNMELNEISSINQNSIEFAYPFTLDFNTSENNPPVIVNINNTQSLNSALGIKNGTSKNIYIHDMSLTQAQTNEITNEALPTNDKKNGLSGIWQEGGAFNSKFQNLFISCYGSFGGNMFTRCEFSNIDVEAKRKLFDFGYGSSNVSIHDIQWKLISSEASDFAASFIIINDGSHDLNMYNIKATGDWQGENIILMSQAKNINIHDIDFDFPTYSKPRAAILIGEQDGECKNINLSNIKFNISKIGLFLSASGDNTAFGDDRNIQLNNISFSGTATGEKVMDETTTGGNPRKAAKMAQKANTNSDKLGVGFLIRNINGIQMNVVNTASGDFLILNANNISLNNIQAPNSNLITKNSDVKLGTNNFAHTMTDVKKIGGRKN